MSELALRLINENRREHVAGSEASFLDLRNCALKRLPDQLLACTWLKELNLDGGNYSDDDEFYDAFGLGGPNQIDENELHKLAKLTGLRTLSLNNNNVRNLQPLSQLTHLRELFLNRTGVSDLHPLSSLVGLNRLALSGTQIINLNPLSELIDLQELYLYDTQVSDIEPLSDLNNLRRLDLTKTRISNLYPLSNLTGLQELYLNRTSVIDFSPLTALVQLRRLDLDGIKVGNITALASIVPLLKNRGFHLSVYGASFLEQSNLVLERNSNHREHILNALLRYDEAVKQLILLPAKVLLLGNHASGKSSLLHYILNGTLSADTDSTHILNIERYPKGRGAELPEAIFFDFGGQDYYHGIYRAFLSPSALQVLVWNKASDRNAPGRDSHGLSIRDYDLLYWLGQKRYLEKMAYMDEPAPLLLVQSHADKDAQTIKITQKQREDASIQGEFFLALKKTSSKEVRKQESARNFFRASLMEVIEATQIRKEEPPWYIHFLEYILAQSTRDDQWRPTTIEEIKKQYEPPGPGYALEADLDQLHRQGLILYYPKELPHVAWLSPGALAAYVHQEILGQLIITDKKGVVFPEVIQQFDPHIVRLLELQKVIFLHRQGMDGPEYIIPNYLPLAEKDRRYQFDVLDMQQLQFVLKFEQFIPFGLINQIICFYGELPEMKRFWRNQLLFRFQGKKVLIQLDFHLLEIRVSSSDNLNVDEQRYLYYSLMALYRNDEPLNFERTILIESSARPPSDKTSDKRRRIIPKELYDLFAYSWLFTHKSDPDDLFLSSNDIDFIRSKDLSDTAIRTTGKILAYPRLNAGLDREKGREINLASFQPFTESRVKVKKVFISYAHDDLLFREAAEEFLVNLKRDRSIEIWHDKEIRPGEIWNDVIQEHLEQSNIIILLVSQKFIKSDYVDGVEMPKAILKAIEKKAIIIPFLLKDCDWHHWRVLPETLDDNEVNLQQGHIGQYQFLPLDDNQRLLPLSEWDHPEKAWMQLVAAIRDRVKGAP